jgi:acetyl esterase/lipase
MAGDESPERRVSRRFSIPIPSFPGIKRKQDRYQTKIQRPRWVLHVQATFWRTLMGLGMFFHRLAPPRPPHPNFHRNIPSTVSNRHGVIPLQFYVPKDYETIRRQHIHDDGALQAAAAASGGHHISNRLHTLSNSVRRRSIQARKWGGYPVVINFHGGGFTLGTAVDDARWCATVVEECNAIVVSVDYRLAPEHPFPTAVDDGVDAVLWIHKHAAELGIDPNRIALSGFSSGGNMAFSVPLRLYDHLTDFTRIASSTRTSLEALVTVNSEALPNDSASRLISTPSAPSSSHGVSVASSSNAKASAKTGATATVSEASRPVLDIKLRCIVPWYPSLDYTRTREYRRATCKRADQELPALFTDLFDDSYLHPPKDVALDSPYLSPGIAPTALLRRALPKNIIMHTCEWDMLLEEGEEFHERLISKEVGKQVVYTMVPGVPHGWDKAPNPIKPTPGVREYYLKACREIRRCLDVEGTVAEYEDEDGQVTAAPEDAEPLVR